MAIEYYGDAAGAVQLGRYEATAERAVGVSLAVFAQPLPEPATLAAIARVVLFAGERRRRQ